MASPGTDTGSDCGSDLSWPSRSPSPPPDLSSSLSSSSTAGATRREVQYPSPPTSQDSSERGTPAPDSTSSSQASDKDGPPPRKRRRVSEKAPRSTEYLDLSCGTVSPDQEAQLDRLLSVLHKRQKIVVVAGAGISVSAGIPDFRSSTGLFTTLRSQHNLKGSGKDLFDASIVYKDANSTSSFHTMVRSMSTQCRAAKPTPFHHMLATLAQEDRLLRLYSQNVDGIDTALEPLKTSTPLCKDESGKWPKTVQLHGGLDKMVCSKCHQLSEFNAELFDGPVPPVCGNCEELNRVRTEIAGKRSHGVGMLRPRMVLYNEHNPDDEAIGSVTRDDLRRRPDAVIVVGTTLKVPGVKRIVREMCATVRDRKDGMAIWINNDPEPSGKEFEDCWDIVVKGTCDEIAQRAAMRRWDEPNEDVEITAERLEAAKKARVSVVIPDLGSYNTTFKPPNHAGSGISTPRKSPQRPAMYTPISSRKGSMAIKDLVGDSTETDEPATPSKKKASVQTQKATFSTIGLGQTKTPAAAPKRGRPKGTTTKTATSQAAARPSTSTKKAQAKKAPSKDAQAKLTGQFKQTKAGRPPKAKKVDSPVKGVSLPEVSNGDIRINSSPTKSVFPHLYRSSRTATEPPTDADSIAVANSVKA